PLGTQLLYLRTTSIPQLPVADNALLDALERILDVAHDRNDRPDLKRRAYRLIERRPEPRERAFLQPTGHRDRQVEAGLLREGIALEVVAVEILDVGQRLDAEAEEELLVLGRLGPGGDEIIEAHPVGRLLEDLDDPSFRRAVALRLLVVVHSGA